VAASPPATDPARLEDIHRGVGAALASFLARQQAVLRGIGAGLEPILAAIEELVAAGKRLRPAFCYWGWRSAGGQDCPEILATAAALELLQGCALVHDDVIDASDTRRGMPAMHRRFESWHAEAGRSGPAERFGAGVAILLGDLLLTWANEMYGSGGLAPDVLYAGAPVWASLQTELAAGQFLDLLSQVNASTSVADAVRVITYKTARYTTERPLQLGATLATAAAGAPPSAAVIAALARYGAPLGIAFQLRDDVLGVFGDPARTGKPVGGDISEGKRTVLMAIARQRATTLQAAILDRHLGNRGLTGDAVAEVRAVLTDTGALAECESLIAAYRKEAVAALDGAPIAADATAALTVLSEIVTDRDELPGLAGPDRQDVRDGPAAPLGDVLDLQAGADKAGEQLAQRVMAHAYPPADVPPPPWRLLMPAGQPVTRMSPDPAVLQPFDVRAVEAGMYAVEHEQSSRPQYPRRLREHGGEVVDVCRDPDRRHCAERPVSERQRRTVTLDYVRGPVPRVPQLIGRPVQADDSPPGGGQRVKVTAATAAQVETQPVARPEQAHDLRGVVVHVRLIPGVVPVGVTVVPCFRRRHR
jgi:geranylgeranyl diphosphate synthase, type I